MVYTSKAMRVMVTVSRLYTEIFCDLYGTIFDIHTDENNPQVWDDMCEYMNKRGTHFSDGEELFNAYNDAMTKALIIGREERGQFVEIDFVPVWHLLYEIGGAHVYESTAYDTATYFHRVSTDYLEPYPHAREFLAVCRRKGIRPILVSNAQESYTLYDLKAHHLTECFDKIFLSSTYGLKKPDKRFFNMALEECGTERSHVVYLGNEIGCDIRGARGAGIDAIYLHTPLSVPGDPATCPDAILNVEGPDYDAVLSWLCKDEVKIQGTGTDAKIVPAKSKKRTRQNS
ncbi:HAD family hydrolase [Alloscardovia theropitheci]|nr:HAD family hydrolase [Alloscardovia theropitheci]